MSVPKEALFRDDYNGDIDEVTNIVKRSSSEKRRREISKPSTTSAVLAADGSIVP
ncbi:MAG: hypothetical protein AB2L22_04055 [Syntrophales bacterium]